MKWCTPHRILPICVSVQTQSLPCVWKNSTGKLTPLISGDTLSVTADTDADWRDQCASQTSFILAAVNYKPDVDDNCELLTESKETATEETTQTDWIYFIRPLCAGKLLSWRLNAYAQEIARQNWLFLWLFNNPFNILGYMDVWLGWNITKTETSFTERVTVLVQTMWAFEHFWSRVGNLTYLV